MKKLLDLIVKHKLLSISISVVSTVGLIATSIALPLSMETNDKEIADQTTYNVSDDSSSSKQDHDSSTPGKPEENNVTHN